jgi:hypothetical protein
MHHITINFIYLTFLGQVKKRFKMSSKRLNKIREDYQFYNSLLNDRKSIFSEFIEINKLKPNKANILQKIEPIEHHSTSDKMVLIVEVKINNHNFFYFKLRYKDYVEQPFFRFDSDGDTHRNKIDGIPLLEQIITTPHFHKFNTDGLEIAYKTDKLLNPQESKALEDINLCIVHFFQESNIRLKEDDFPEVKIMSDTLGFSYIKEDPNLNVIFP